MAGLVVDAQSGKPIPKAQIKINHLERTVESDAGGRFDIKSLCVDTVFLTIHSPHYHAKTVAKKATTDQILEFELSPSRGSVTKPVATVGELATITKENPIPWVMQCSCRRQHPVGSGRKRWDGGSRQR